MVIDTSYEGKIKRFIPKHEPESAFLWIFQRVTGVLVFFFLIFHMLVNHYLNLIIPENIAETYGIASFEGVVWKMNNPFYFWISLIFVIVLLFHALNGFRTVLLDLAPNPTLRKVLGIILIVLGIVGTLYIFYLNITVASFIDTIGV